MRTLVIRLAGVFFSLLVLSSAAAQIPPPYLAPKYVAPPNAPSNVVVVGREEPGERMVITGRVTDAASGGPISGASIYVFHTDLNGRYIPGTGRDSDENARLHGALRTDREGRYQFETIRPGNYPQGGAPAHIHYVLNAAGYTPRMFELWFDDDSILARWRREGKPDVPDIYPPGVVEVRKVIRDPLGIWHATRDMQMVRE
jgi:protocatechuate 3,4-dioxygenase beta subunit